MRYDNATMIAQISGKISYKGSGFVIVSDGTLGYKVFVPKNFLANTKENDELFLWTHLAVREDVIELYGFPGKDDVNFFELLMTVSGVGPRSALAIVNLASVKTLSRAIAAGDATYLTKVSGIGKKTAAKIVVELKDKIIDICGISERGTLEGEGEAIDALKSLGYSTAQARGALQKIGLRARDSQNEKTGLNETIKEALKILSESPS